MGKLIKAIYIFFVFLAIGLWFGAVYVAVHFIQKYW